MVGYKDKLSAAENTHKWKKRKSIHYIHNEHGNVGEEGIVPSTDKGEMGEKERKHVQYRLRFGERGAKLLWNGKSGEARSLVLQGRKKANQTRIRKTKLARNREDGKLTKHHVPVIKDSGSVRGGHATPERQRGARLMTQKRVRQLK